jgi:hypothetical protein
MRSSATRNLFFAVLVVMTKFEADFVLFVSHSHIDALIENEIYQNSKSCHGNLVESIEDIIKVAKG